MSSAAVTATTTQRRDRWTAAVAAIGYVVLGRRYRRPPGRAERGVFARLNHHGDDSPALRVPQQLGTPWVLPGIALAAFWFRRPHLVLVAGFALPLEKALEVGLKKIFDRKRPAQLDPDVRLRDDAPTDGPSYPSGHAAIATAAVTCLAPYVPRPVVGAGVGVAAMTSAVRIRQGAHFPMDAVGGVLLGVTVTYTLTALFGRPAEGSLPGQFFGPAMRGLLGGG